MTHEEKDRLDVLEAKVDRILTILDDPDFGIRYDLRNTKNRIRGIEMKVYGLMAGIVTSFGLVVATFVMGK